MKKIIFFLVAAIAATACQKDPDLSDLDNDYLVYTAHDTSANFGSFSTFYIPDSILVVEQDTDIYLTGTAITDLIGEYVVQMTAAGYTQVSDRASADLGLQISYIKSIHYIVDNYKPYWWWGYPYYWSPGYWGNWYNWYYGYPVYYTYSTATFLTEMIDLDGVVSGTTKQLPIIWNSFIGGLLSASDTYDTDKVVVAIQQSFVQSPFIKKTN